MLKKLLSEPLIHFLVFSLIIFLSFENNEPEVIENTTVVVSQGRIEQLKNDIIAKKQRQPVKGELAIAIDSYTLNEIYIREARELGLDVGDRVIERRLRQKMEFLLDEMASVQQPTAEELVSFYQANINNYLSPLTVTFKQAYVSTDVDSVTLQAYLKAQLALIDKGSEPISEPSMLPTMIIARPMPLIEKDFGQQFSKQLNTLPRNQWVGPIDSGFGKHFVFIESIVENQPLALSSIKDTVIHDWQYQKRKAFKMAYENELKRRYVVDIEENATTEIDS